MKAINFIRIIIGDGIIITVSVILGLGLVMAHSYYPFLIGIGLLVFAFILYHNQQ